MERREHVGLILDFCKHCHGVWFDNAELSAIWRVNLAITQSASARRRKGADVILGDGLVDVMFWSPDLVVYGGAAAIEGIGHVAGAAADVAGGAAEGVFSAVLEIISGLFDGL